MKKTCSTLREYFFCAKKPEITLFTQPVFSPELPSFRHFREYHNAYARFPLRKQRLLRRLRSCARFPPSLNSADYVKYVLRYPPLLGGEDWLSKLLFLFSLRKKSILIASQNWSWATDVTWTVLPIYLLRFWTWEHFSCVAVYGGSESSPI